MNTTPLQVQQPQHQVHETNAKMLIVLPDGEQRLITFSLPKEPCSVHELLEQLQIPTVNRNVTCIQTHNNNDIDFVVTVTEDERTHQLQRQVVAQSMGQSTPQLAAAIHNTVPMGANANSQELQQAVMPKNETPSKYVDGYLAICEFCGVLSLDHAKCERCLRTFTKLPRRQKIEMRQQPLPTMAAQAQQQNSRPTNGPMSSRGRTGVHAISRSSMSITTSGGVVRGGRVISSGYAARGRGGRPSTAKVVEPVIYMLSSDDEDDESAGKANKQKQAGKSDGNVVATEKTGAEAAQGSKRLQVTLERVPLKCEPTMKQLNDPLGIILGMYIATV